MLADSSKQIPLSWHGMTIKLKYLAFHQHRIKICGSMSIKNEFPTFEFMKEKISKVLPFFTIGFVLLMACSLYFGWLNTFFFGAEHAQVQGIDYFAVPKSYLNLMEGKSLFDTWGGVAYGPYATWYLAHPAFSVFIASWFSYFSPWISYALFAVFSLAVMVYCAYLISTITENVFHKRLAYTVILCAFPTYWMLYVGNMHAPLVLALTLMMISLYEHAYNEKTKRADSFLFAGLLISFFSKPIVLLMLPLFLLLKETRKITFLSLIIYAFVSLLFIIVPVLNPESVGWTKLTNILFDFDFIRQNLNIYKNGFVLNEYMKDNSIHWLNLIAQSDHKLMHIDVFSLPVFVDTLLGRSTPAGIYKLPIYISLMLSIAIPFIEDKKIRLESALLLVMAISLTFFLSYNTVWEYQFASVLPVIAILPILKQRNVFYAKNIPLMFIAGLFVCLPSLYFLVHNGNYQTNAALTLIRITRIIPVLIIFIVMIFHLIVVARKYAKLNNIKRISFSPEKFFFE
jgi:hypothetical protein